MCARRRKKSYENIQIEGLSSEAMGIYRHEGKVIFVEGTMPGDVVDAQTYKKKKGFEIARMQRLHQASSKRQEPFCQHFADCGGCKTQYLSYEDQLGFKQQVVVDAFRKLAKTDCTVDPIVGCESDQYYRNKLEFSFSNKRWLSAEEAASDDEFASRNALGFHVPKYFDKVVDIQHCHLQGGLSNDIRNWVNAEVRAREIAFYDLREHTGVLRNLMIKTAPNDQCLVLLSIAVYDEAVKELLDDLRAAFPSITSLQYVVNTKRNDTIWDLDVQTHSGDDCIYESLGGLQFKVGAKSFFQTNPAQAHRLYQLTKDMAQLKASDVVYDLYTGVGSIALFLADACKAVHGIEIVPEAIADAKKNAQLNNIDNATFIAGDMKDTLNEDFIKAKGRPDVVVLDPPRAGCHPDVIEVLNFLRAPRIVYVSCNPATQARDVALLSEHYTVKQIQPVDMFPHTIHVENVCLLELKTDGKSH